MVSAEQIEVAQFSARAGQWWQPDGAFKTLHHINPTRLRFITEQCTLNNKKVLDVACGGGLLAEAMARCGAHVTGIDLSSESIAAAQAHAATQQLDIDYRTESIAAHAANHHETYDVISCMELVEHVIDIAAVVAACAKLVKPGGAVIFATINRQLKAYLLAIVIAEQLLQLIPKNTHHYQQFVRPSELAACCRQHGLTVDNLQGLAYNPILKRGTLTNDPSVNYLIKTTRQQR